MGTEQNNNPQYQSLFTALLFAPAYLLCLWPNNYLALATIFILLLGLTVHTLQNGLNHFTPLTWPLLTWPLLLFIGSASLGVWSAYNTQQATTKLLILLVAVLIAIYLSSFSNKERQNDEKTYSYLAIGSIIFSIASLAISPLGIERGELLTPNRLAGLIGILTPFLLLALVTTRSKGRRIIVTSGLVIVLIALIVSGSRGGIVALSIGLGLWGLLVGKRPIKPRMVAIALLSIFSIGVIGLLTVSRLSTTALTRIPGSGSRLTLYSNLQHLIPDFWLLGGGLNSFSGHYSQYILSIPHLRFTYGHNLYFDLMLEQGAVGLASFCFLILISVVLLLNYSAGTDLADDSSHHIAGAVLASITTLILHGFIDNAMYSNAGSTMLFVAPALAFSHSNFDKPNRLIRWIGLCVITTVIALSALFNSRLISAWHSNLGAIEMAKIQLADWPTGEWSDGTAADSLEKVAPQFKTAIETNQNNTSALYRLGLIEMENRNFLQAQKYLNQAYDLDPAHIGIKKNLGYALLWSGEFEEAGVLLNQAEGINNELDAYIWWWQTANRPDLSEVAKTMRQSGFITSPQQ